MSLLAMVTITSGTLYGVFKWLSMVALTPPKTKVKIHADRRLCYGNTRRLTEKTKKLSQELGSSDENNDLVES